MIDLRRTILLSMLMNLLVFGFVLSLFGPSSPKMMEDFEVDFAIIGITVTAQSLGTMFTFFTGGLGDKYGSYYITKWSLFGLGFSTILMGLSPNIIFLFLFSFLSGIPFGTFNACFNQVIMDLYPKAKVRMLNTALVSMGIGFTVGPTVVATINSLFAGWRIGYILFGTILVVASLFQFLVRTKEVRRPKASEGKGDYNRLFAVLLVVLFFFSIFATGINSWLPTYIFKTNKASYLEAGMILSSFWAVVTVVRLFSWKVTERLGGEKTIALFCLIGFVIGTVSIFVSGFIPNVIAWGSMGIAHALVWPLTMAIAYVKYPSSPGKVIGRLIAFGTIGSIIAAPLIGTLSNITSLDIATLVIPFSCLIVSLIYFELTRLS